MFSAPARALRMPHAPGLSAGGGRGGGARDGGLGTGNPGTYRIIAEMNPLS
jgi:hypothetical protein